MERNLSIEAINAFPVDERRDIDEHIDIGLKEFYLRPKQIWRMFITINSMGDLLRKLYGLKAFMHYFAQKFMRLLTGQGWHEKPRTKFLHRQVRSQNTTATFTPAALTPAP